jgi:hypothetical protein
MRFNKSKIIPVPTYAIKGERNYTSTIPDLRRS